MARHVAPERPERASYDLLAQYELLEELGCGDHGCVYRARDRVLEQAVAVKLLRRSLSRDTTLVAQRYVTARTATGLRHPQIVTVYDYGEQEGSAFFTSELLTGPNLAELLKQYGPLPFQQTLSIGVRVLDALAATHLQGLVHGDLHPRNLLLRGKSTTDIVITDFGMVQADDTATITPYRDPASSPGEPLTVAADLYAVAVILYELLTGERPTVAGLTRRPPAIPRLVFATLRQALAPEPADRYPSAVAFREALVRAAGIPLPASWIATPAEPLKPAERLPAKKPARNPRQPYRIAAGIAGALIVGGLAAGGFLLASPPNTVQAPASGSEEAAAVPTATLTLESPVATATPNSVAIGLAPGNSSPVAAATAPAVGPTPTPAASSPAAVLAPSSNLPPATGAAAKPASTSQQPGPPQIVTQRGTGGAVRVGLENFSPYQLQGAYQLSDVRTRDQAQVALYGAGSGYNVAILTFEATTPLPTGQITLVLSGLNDERGWDNTIQVLLNGRTLYSGASNFANRSASTLRSYEGTQAWSQMIIVVPAGTIQTGTNSLVIRNLTPGEGQLPPYILIHNLEFANEKP